MKAAAALVALLACLPCQAQITPGLGEVMRRSFDESTAEMSAGRIPMKAKTHAQEAYRRAMGATNLPRWLHDYYKSWIAEAGKVDDGAITLEEMFKVTDLELRRLGQLELTRLADEDRERMRQQRQAPPPPWTPPPRPLPTAPTTCVTSPKMPGQSQITTCY